MQPVTDNTASSFDVYDPYLGQSTWVLTETRLRAHHLRRYLRERAAELSKQQTVRVMTVGDGVRLLLSQTILRDDGKRSQIGSLTGRERLAVLTRLIEEHRRTVPILHQIILRTAARELFSTEIDRIASLLDALRLYRTTEALLQEFLDEYGNVREEKRWHEEIFFLLERYRDAQEELRRFDPIGAAEKLAFELERAAAQRGGVEAGTEHRPGRILLDLPETVPPLFELIWAQMERSYDLRYVADSALLEPSDAEAPSKRYSQPLRAFLTRTAERESRILPVVTADDKRKSLVSYLLDYEHKSPQQAENQRSDFTGVQTLAFQERRDEVRAVVHEIRSRIAKSEVRPEEVHILASDLDSYLPLLESACREFELPFGAAKGFPLWQSTPGALLLALCRWYERGSLKNAYAVFTESSSRARTIDQETFSAFVNKHRSQIEQVTKSAAFQQGIRSKEWRSFLDDHSTPNRDAPDLSWRIAPLYDLALRLGLDIDGLDDPRGGLKTAVFSYFSRILEGVQHGSEEVGPEEGPEEGVEQLARISAIADEFWMVLRALVGIEQEYERRNALLGDRSRAGSVALGQQFLTAVRKHHQHLRARIRDERGSRRGGKRDREMGEERDLLDHRAAADYLRAVREVRHLLFHTAQMLDDLTEVEFEKSSAVQERSETPKLLSLLRRELERALRSSYATTRYPRAESDSEQDPVLASEFLDARALWGKHVYLLGATADQFPVRSRSGMPFTDLFQTAEEYTARRAGKIDESYESLAILSHLLRNNRTVTFSHPRQSIERELEPAAFVYELSKLLSGESSSKVASLTAGEDRSPQTPWSERAARLIAKRRSGESSPYEGAIDPASIARLRSAGHPILQPGSVDRYSVSSLERLVDCPHRFFFSDLLRLREEQLSFVEEIAKHTGDIVHEALRRFFARTSGNGAPIGRLVTEASFAADCEEMLAIAKELFKVSPIDWEIHPALRQAKLRIVAGLQSTRKEDGSRLRRGYLRAALEYQRDFVGTAPVALEFRFGAENSPVIIPSEEGEIRLRGTIDRIDRAADGTVAAIFDYKTGRRVAFRDVEQGRSLQIPLYAYAVRETEQFGAAPLRGGLIHLGRPDRTDPEMRSLAEGVLAEHLAIRRQGVRLAWDDTAVAGRIDTAIAQVKRLDELVRKGRFQQLLDTKGCPTCEMRRICARDEVVLEERARRVEFAALVTTDQSPPPEAERFRLEDLPSGVSPAGAKGRNGTSTSSSGSLADFTLSAEQAAACDINSNIILVAGAGSGKTAVLWNRVIELVLAGTSINSILAITFTERAASEMRVRIDRAISDILRAGRFRGSPLTPEQRRALLDAKYGLPSASIGTFHALAGQFVRMDEELSQVPGTFQILSGPDELDVVRAAVAKTLRSQQASDLLLERGIPYAALVSVVERLARRSIVLGDLRRTQEEAKEEILRHLQNYISKRTEEIAAALEQFLVRWERDASGWFSTASAVTGKAAFTPEVRGDFELLIASAKQALGVIQSRSGKDIIAADWIEKFVQLREIAVERSSSQRSRSKSNPRNYWKELRDYLLEVDEDLLRANLQREQTALELAKEIIQLASIAQEEYRQLKRDRDAVDFDDLILALHTMLCAGTVPKSAPELHDQQDRFRARIRRSFRHILVDEFQDTDPLQWEIVQAIYGERDPAEPRSLFLVGDRKQAIYGFRGGDLRVFDRALEEGRRAQSATQLVSLSLKENYRSSQGVVNFVNETFMRLLDGSTHYEPLVAKRVAISTTPAPQVFRLTHLRGEGSRRKVTHSEEAAGVASYIGNVLGSLTSRSKSESSPWDALLNYPTGGRIAVLTRTVRHLLLVADALQLRAIPFSISHSSGFYELDEIVMVENLLRILAKPEDYLSLVGALRSPLFGYSDEELVELFSRLQGGWRGIERSSEEVSVLIKQWRERSALVPVSRLLEEIFASMGMKSGYLAAGELETYRNVERLIEQLRTAELKGRSTGTVRGALEWFAAQRREGMTAPNAYNTAHDVVLTTVHGAKGLEYPLAVLPYLSVPITEYQTRRMTDFPVGEIAIDGSTTGSARTATLLGVQVEDEQSDYKRKRTVIDQIIADEALRSSIEEEKRIFYVACTRAREYLVLSVREGKGEVREGEESGSEANPFNSYTAPAEWIEKAASEASR